MTSGKAVTSSHRTRQSLITLLLVICVVVAAFLFLATRQDRQVFQVTNDIALQVVGVDSRQGFRPTRLVRSAAYRMVPGWAREALGMQPRRRDWSGRRSSRSRSGSSFSYVLEAQFPPEWADRYSRDEIYDRIEAELDKANANTLKLHYGDGWYSSRGYLARQDDPGDGRIQFRAGFGPVPLTVKNFELHFIGESASRPTKSTATYSVQNPIYRNMKPLADVKPMPVTHSRDGVDVTLVNLVSQTGLPGQKSADGVEIYDLARQGKFLRSRGTLNQPHNSGALFQISDATTSEPRWVIKSTSFYYGEDLLRYTPSAWTTPEVLATTDSASLQMLFFPNFDPGVLRQPVRVSVELERNENLAEDEILEVELPVPAKGMETEKVKAEGLWSGPITVAAAHTGRIKRGNSSFSGSDDDLSIIVENVDKGAKVTTVTLRGVDATSSASLTPGGSGSFTSYIYSRFGFADRNDWKKKKQSYQDFTTITATITLPRRFDRRFEFTVEPTIATVEPAPAQ